MRAKQCAFKTKYEQSEPSVLIKNVLIKTKKVFSFPFAMTTNVKSLKHCQCLYCNVNVCTLTSPLTHVTIHVGFLYPILSLLIP